MLALYPRSADSSLRNDQRWHLRRSHDVLHVSGLAERELLITLPADDDEVGCRLLDRRDGLLRRSADDDTTAGSIGCDGGDGNQPRVETLGPGQGSVVLRNAQDRQRQSADSGDLSRDPGDVFRRARVSDRGKDTVAPELRRAGYQENTAGDITNDLANHFSDQQLGQEAWLATAPDDDQVALCFPRFRHDLGRLRLRNTLESLKYSDFAARCDGTENPKYFSLYTPAHR